MLGHGASRGSRGARRIARPPLVPFFHRPTLRQVAVDRVVGGRLIGQGIRADAALQQSVQHVDDVAEERDRYRLGVLLRRFEQGERFVERARLGVYVARFQAFGDAALAAFDRQHVETRHGGSQRLRPAHAAETGREYPLAADLVVEMAPAHFGEGFVGALHDALTADIDPRAGGHLAVHGETLAIELVEVFPGRPVRDQIGIGNQHARRVRMRREYAHRLAGLHQQGFLLGQGFQCFDDAVVAIPIARGATDAAVHDELGGVLGHFGVQVVHQHAQRRFGHPAPCAQCAATRGADITGLQGGEHGGILGGEPPRLRGATPRR